MKYQPIMLLVLFAFTQNGLQSQCATRCPEGKNSFFGQNAGDSLTTGVQNSFFGHAAGFAISTGSFNSFFGQNAGRINTTGEFNSFFGQEAGYLNTNGSNNSFFGQNAGRHNASGMDNSFFGQEAGYSNTTGVQNSFFGENAGVENTTGSYNSFFGENAGFSNTSGVQNNFYGEDAGYFNTTGFSNSFYGQVAGRSNTTGNDNSFFGQAAGLHMTTGSGNIILGRGSGPTADSSDLDMRLFIDVDTASFDGNNDPLIYGEFDNDFVRINGTFEVTAGLTNPSSRLLKENFDSLDAETVLSKLSALEVSQWNYKHRPKEKHVGPVAEDFYQLFGLGSGNSSISTIDADGVMMLAIKALKEENEILKTKLAQQEERLSRQEELIRAIIKNDQ